LLARPTGKATKGWAAINALQFESAGLFARAGPLDPMWAPIAGAGPIREIPTLLNRSPSGTVFFIWSCWRDVPMSCKFERQREMPPAGATSQNIIIFFFLARA
jgi:hypothetical protein